MELGHEAESLEILTRVVTQTADAVLIADQDGNIEYVNPAFERITGYERSEVKGKTPRILRSGKHPPDFYEDLWKTVKSGRPFKAIFHNRRKNGDLYYEEVLITPLTDASGKITHLVSTGRDVTERMRIDQLKDEFVQMVSHEFRTPITILSEAITQVRDGLRGEINAIQKRALTLSLNATERLGRMVDELLDISKIEAGVMRLNPQRFNMAEVAQDAIATFSMRYARPGLEWKVSVPPEPVELVADHDKVTQILTNLIGNASKFTEKGFIELAVADAGESVECRVRDSGPGIAPEDLPHIFDKFTSFREIGISKEKGTGLGLPISKGLIEMHGGSLRVESRLGEGTTFIFVLPKNLPT